MSYITESGVPDLGKIPWGTHFCQMYSKKDELAQSLIPYILTGLANNERCIWVTCEPYNAENAAADLKNTLPELGNIIKKGRLRICDYDEWYTNAGTLNDNITQHWLDEEERALREGYEGLRISGNTAFVTPPVWDAFMQYEQEVHKSLSGRRILALCSYNISKIEPSNLFEMVRAHQFSIRRHNGFWEMLDPEG